MKSILVLDGHPMMLQAMRSLAQAVFPHAEVRHATTFEEAELAARGPEALDLALLDLGLPGWRGISALTAFRQIAPRVPAVVVSASEDRQVVLSALEAGAKGYIPKTSTPELFAAALRVVAVGGTYVPPQALGEAIAEPASPAQRLTLTERQLQVLRLIARGRANKEIAQDLSIAIDTVKQHAKTVYAALGIANRAQAVHAAQRCGIKLG